MTGRVTGELKQFIGLFPSLFRLIAVPQMASNKSVVYETHRKELGPLENGHFDKSISKSKTISKLCHLIWPHKQHQKVYIQVNFHEDYLGSKGTMHNVKKKND